MPTIYCDKAALPLRREHDFYPTDRATVRAALSAFCAHLHQHPQDIARPPALWRALDPGAGTGIWGEELAARHPLAMVWGVECRAVPPHPSYDGWVEDDFLTTMELPGAFQLVLGNPPYRHAQAFVERALFWVQDGGHVLFLLPLSFLEGRRRHDTLYRQQPLRRLWACLKRPSFTGDGKRGPTAYGLYLWQKGFQGEATIGYLRDE